MPLPLQGKPPPSRWVKPGSAGAGYASKKLRVPKWEPKWDMPGSTVVSSAACCLLLPTLSGCARCSALSAALLLAGAGDAVQLQRLLRHRLTEGLRLPAVRLCAHRPPAALVPPPSVHPSLRAGSVRWAGSNRKDEWCQAKPMTCSESIANQSAMLHAADPDVKIGV